jgi:serine/threonine protein kinase
VKPENVLLDKWRLKLADFGSAKELGEGPSQSYICSRWWRAPELILGATEYTMSVDWWSCGCVIGEMMQGQPLFQGASNGGQIYEIIEVLGTPSQKEVEALTPKNLRGPGGGRMLQHLKKLAALKRPGRAWQAVLPDFAACAPEALEILPCLLAFDPKARRPPAELLVSRGLAGLSKEAPCALFEEMSLSGELAAFPPRVRRGLLEMSGKARRRGRALQRRSSEGGEWHSEDAAPPLDAEEVEGEADAVASATIARIKRPRIAAAPSPRVSLVQAASPRSDEL